MMNPQHVMPERRAFFEKLVQVCEQQVFVGFYRLIITYDYAMSYMETVVLLLFFMNALGK